MKFEVYLFYIIRNECTSFFKTKQTLMKHFLIIFVLTCNLTFAISANFSTIDNQSKTIPSTLKTVPEIASHLTRNLNNPTDKARAIYVWIAHNIRYDLSQVNSPKQYLNASELVTDVLTKRKGVCQNYAELFHACCQSVGVKSFVVVGYTGDSLGVISPIGHAWNAIEIDNSYYNIDVTWAAGYVQNGAYVHRFRDLYFMKTSTEFVPTHMPFDPIWQFSNSPITHNTFLKGIFTSNSPNSRFNYKDSINSLSNQSVIERKHRENLRMINSGLTNKLLKDRVTSNNQYIDNEVLNSEKTKFNKASSEFSIGVNEYNTFVSKLNEAKGDYTKLQSVKALLTSALNHINNALQIVQDIKSSDANLTKNINDMKAYAVNSTKSIQEQLSKFRD